MGDAGMLNPGLFPGREGSARVEGGKLRMKHHPPFNNSAKRFEPEGADNGPFYHVAYSAVTQPERRTTKGWAAMDDAIKGARGTSTGKVHSSLAPRSHPPAPGSMLQPLYTSYPNETRLQELLDLQRRRLGQAPGPGQYDVAGWQPSRTCFRRQAIEQLDGPFVAPLDANGQTTRDREMAALLQQSVPDSGVPPGAYNPEAGQDRIKRAAPTTKIGTSERSGRSTHTKVLSVSRSIQHGIDWHVPVVVQVKPADEQPHGAADAKSSPEADAVGKTLPPATPPLDPGSIGAAGTEPADDLLGPDGSDFGAQARHKARTPPLPVPVGGKTPQPPAAVARSIRAQAKALPSDWDWQRLGHNYRTNWTTMHGGAYSQGDRSTERRDMQQPDAIDLMGTHVEGMDLRSLPPDQGTDMFPIPEEGNLYADISGHANGLPSRGSDRTALDSAGTDAAATTAAGSPAPTAGASGPQASGTVRGPPSPDSFLSTPVPPTAEGGAQEDGGEAALPALLTRADITRREAAQAAAARAQQAAARRAAWQSKASIVV